MESDDLLYSCNARSQQALARANGTSMGEEAALAASGWVGGKVARSGRLISPHPRRDNEQAWREHGQVCLPPASEQEPEAYPSGYVEDSCEMRTPLAGFFSILLIDIWRSRSDQDGRSGWEELFPACSRGL